MQCPEEPITPYPCIRFQPFTLLKGLFGRMTGSPIESDLGEYWRMVERIKTLDLSGMADSQLAERTRRIAQLVRERISDPPSSEIEVETFALVKEAARRTVFLDPFDVQLIAGMAMARGCIAELPTGEGKTLAAVFPACLRSLSGRGVHVLTFNDYLARRDASWMGPIYRMLGLSVGCIQEGSDTSEKKTAYACDVTYAAAKEAGFDFLRDQVAYDRGARVHRPFSFALIDEADSILIDEARIPLVISGAEDRASWDTHLLASVVRALLPDRDFETDCEHRNVFLTDAGIERVESMLGCGSLYAADNQTLLEAVYCALHARALLRLDVDYIVRGGRIEIVDEYSGRVVDKRHWPDGLQAAVEAKEGLSRKIQGRVLGSITLQHFFRLYPAVSGMTATAQSAADEIYEFYGMRVVVIPPHMPSIRVDHPDIVLTHREAKNRAIVREIMNVHARGRPILVGTSSIKESEGLAGDLRSAGIDCAVLNARNDELEAAIIAKAGMPGTVTISTNMAGRGVDIKLGGSDESRRDDVLASGGLYVIGTNHHESLRIDRQLRGRAGRQGDPGATRFFISLEDDLFDHYGLTKMLMRRHGFSLQDEALTGSSIRSAIAHAQRTIEGQNFDIRRTLFNFSSLVEVQRQIVQSWREEALLGSCEPEVSTLDDSASVSFKFSLREPILYEEGVRRFGTDRMIELERRATLFHLDRLWADHLAWIQDTRDSIHLVHLGAREPLEEFLKWAADEFFKMEKKLDEAVISEIASIVRKNGPVALDLERLKGPSSTWTYMVNDANEFGWGVEMVKARKMAFFAVGNSLAGPALINAAIHGPLFMLTLLLSRRRKRNREAKTALDQRGES